MPKQVLTLESLSALDNGKIPAAFNEHMQRVLRDLEERTLDDRARKITLEVELAPEGDDTVNVAFNIKSSMPDHKSKRYNMLMKHTGGQKMGLLFDPVSDDDVKQATLDLATLKVG